MITCLDIGGSGIKGALARSTSDLTPLGRVRTPINDLHAFVAAIEEMLSLSPAPKQATVAISTTGVIDPNTGIIKVANIPCIDGLPIAQTLSERLGRPVVVGNDADLFALAEAVAGAGRGHRIVFGAILGTGVVVKRPGLVSVDGKDAIAIRSYVYLALSYDHRIVDGADAARFLTTVKKRLEDASFQGQLGI